MRLFLAGAIGRGNTELGAFDAALVSAGGSTIYALGAPPGRDAWDVDIQDPSGAGRVALTVSLRNVEVTSFGVAEVLIAGGLTPDDLVVSAGVQALRPGQKVRLLKAAP